MRDPLKPKLPADAQPIAFPWTSVIVIIVLLKVAWTCATAEVMFFLSRLLTRELVGFAILYPVYFKVLFLPAIGRAGPLRVRALVCVRWPRTGRPRRCLKPR